METSGVVDPGPSLLEERRRNREAARNSRRWNRMYDGDVEGDIELPTYSTSLELVVC